MSLEGLLKYPFIFCLSALTAYFLTPLCLKAAVAIGMVDSPGERRLNATAIPRGGGVAVFAGLHLAAAFVFFYPWSASFSGSLDTGWYRHLLAASLVLLAVGLLDDAFSLNWFLKLGGQIAAALMIYAGDVRIGSIQGMALPEWLDLMLTVGWFLAFVNAFNLIDGLDGLASGLAAIAALGLSFAAMFRNLPTDALLLLALSGACLGFLRYNFHPARIFLGDSGSMVIGFTLAAIGLEGTSKGTTIAAIGVPFLAIGVPIFDVMLAVWRRSVKALVNRDKGLGKVVQADMEHLHHRLLKNGFTQRRVALSLYAFNALLVGFGLLTVVFNSRSTGIFLLAVVVGSYVVVRHLAHFELWDSGRALLSGMRRPGKSMLPALLYPLVDAALLVFSLLVSTTLIFMPQSLAEFREVLSVRIPVWGGVPFILLALSGTYNRVWSRARPSEFAMLGLVMAGAIALCLAVRLIINPEQAPRSLLIAITHGCLASGLIVGIRTLPRLIQDFMIFKRDPRSAAQASGGMLIYGAGARALLFLRRASYNEDGTPLGNPKRILGFIDDDVGLRKRRVHGYEVLGTWEDFTRVVDRCGPDEIVITCGLGEERVRKLAEYCAVRGIRLVEWVVGEKLLVDGRGAAVQSAASA